MEEVKSWVEYYVRDANGLTQGPWDESVCIQDVKSGRGGIKVLRRTVTQEVVYERVSNG